MSASALLLVIPLSLLTQCSSLLTQCSPSADVRIGYANRPRLIALTGETSRQTSRGRGAALRQHICMHRSGAASSATRFTGMAGVQ